MMNMLGFTFLWGGVRARQAEVSTVSEEECAGTKVVKLAAVVALDCFDGGAEQGSHIEKEVSESRECVRLES